jgi:hypothetical protein
MANVDVMDIDMDAVHVQYGMHIANKFLNDFFLPCYIRVPLFLRKYAAGMILILFGPILSLLGVFIILASLFYLGQTWIRILFIEIFDPHEEEEDENEYYLYPNPNPHPHQQ